MNGLVFAAVLLSTGVYAMSQEERYKKYRYKTYQLKDESKREIGFSPIRHELPNRFEDLDISEIFHGRDLQDCQVNTEGPTPSPSPEPETK